MSVERKGTMMRALFSLGLIAVAAGVAFWIGVPGFGFGEKEKEGESELTPENIQAFRNKKGCVVVIHNHLPDNEDSENTREILDELEEEKRYENLVEMAELNIEKYPELGEQEGVTKENAPQLTFYIEGTRVGNYRGPWQKEPVQRKIDEILRGYMQRIGKDWRPPVPGMERASENDAPILEIRPAKE